MSKGLRSLYTTSGDGRWFRNRGEANGLQCNVERDEIEDSGMTVKKLLKCLYKIPQAEGEEGE